MKLLFFLLTNLLSCVISYGVSPYIPKDAPSQFIEVFEFKEKRLPCFFLNPYRFTVSSSGSPGTTNLAAWWALNEASGSRLDSHGSADLTAGAGVGYDASGKISGCADMARSATSTLLVADSDAVSFDGRDWTVGGWVKLDTLYAGNYAALLIGKRAAGASTVEMILYFDAFFDSADASLYIGNGTTFAPIKITSLTLATGTWYFWCARWDDSTKIATLWIDQTSVSSTTEFTGYNIPSTAQPLALGHASWSNTATDLKLDGRLDEVFKFDAALTDEQIAWLYNSGTGRAYADL